MIDALKEYEAYLKKLNDGYVENSVYTGDPKIDKEKNKTAMNARKESLGRMIEAEKSKPKEA